MTELIDELETRGLDGDLVRLEGGYENDVFRLGPHVARVAAPWIDLDRVRAEHAVMAHMAVDIPEAPIPEGEPFLWSGRVVSVFPFRRGGRLDRDDEEQRLSSARLLARVHRRGLRFEGDGAIGGLEGLDWERNAMWDMSRVRTALEGLRDGPLGRLEPYHRELRARARELRARSLATGIVHGDWWPGNLLVQRDRITAVLDWLETRRDWLAYELGRGIWEFCSNRTTHELLSDRADAYLEAYLAAGGPVPEGELDVLVDMMRISALTDALYALTYEGPTDEVVTYHEGSVRRLDTLTRSSWSPAALR